MLNQEYPTFLDADEELIFKEEINKRFDFVEFFNTKLNPFINQLLTNNLQDTKNSIFIIGGSRSWDNLINNYTEIKNNLTKVELSSITPGNYDIFCICNNKKKVNNIMNLMCKTFDKIIDFCHSKDIDVKFVRNYEDENNNKKLYKKNGNINCLLNNNYFENGCVFAPCKAMHLEIVGGKYNEKVLIYFELILNEKNNIIEYINNNIINLNSNNNLNYLNLKGLYLFSELIISKRIDKDFDIDNFRKNILNKLFDNQNINKLKIYNKIIQIYSYLFHNTINYKFNKTFLIKQFILLSDNNIFNNYNSFLTEIFRPYINSFILNTLNNLNYSSTFLNFVLFITGGDAYRRYLPNIITQTNDIDLKLIYTNKNDYEILLNKIIFNMSELIYILYSNKINFVHKINNLITIEFISKYTGGQFRLRYTKNDNFTLLSIDYRYKLKIFNKYNNSKIIINQEFALLDLVLYNENSSNNSNNIYNKNGLPYIHFDNIIPIASANYLINDLRKIYDNINKDLKHRFFKKSKDKNRFKNLIEYINKFYNNNNYSNINLKRKRNTNDDVIINLKKVTFNKNPLNDIIINNNNNNNKIIGNELNKYINLEYYNELINITISNEYAKQFINKIKNNSNTKILMNFDDIKNISSEYSNSINNITDKFSNLSLNNSDIDSENSDLNSEDFDLDIDFNNSDIDSENSDLNSEDFDLDIDFNNLNIKK